jgi:hypothetical protein
MAGGPKPEPTPDHPTPTADDPDVNETADDPDVDDEAEAAHEATREADDNPSN